MKKILMILAFLAASILTPKVNAEQTRCYTVFQDGRVQLCCTYGNVVSCS